MRLQPFIAHQKERSLVFVDTEFTHLDPKIGELLSIGMVKPSGEELYLELNVEKAVTSVWVDHHVLPLLTAAKVTKQQAREQMAEFLGDSRPYLVAFIDNYDILHLTNLFGVGQLPFRWMSVDFSSILFGQGLNPVIFDRDSKGARKIYASLGIDITKFRAHHALDDARLLKELWSALSIKSEK